MAVGKFLAIPSVKHSQQPLSSSSETPRRRAYGQLGNTSQIKAVVISERLPRAIRPNAMLQLKTFDIIFHYLFFIYKESSIVALKTLKKHTRYYSSGLKTVLATAQQK